ncbi:hypothetical protein QE152_g15532 [Popillia japonica]|uniref:Uncharacterized protein n=1 Tax=Popillia japonica TaxID=7064 RepID=A0AAW1L840_POPJA
MEGLERGPDASGEGGSSPVSYNTLGNVEETTESVKTFANAVKSNSSNYTFPDRELAIIFDALEDTEKNDYIFGVGELIGPRNISFASRISNNRICMYLASKEIIDTFINNHEGIKIKNHFVKARRLVSPAKRIILSNVSPSIPHEVIIREIKSLGLNVASSMTFIGAGVTNPEYKHVLSFRRQIYIVLDEKSKLPESMLIAYKQNYFRIFLTTDEIRCFSYFSLRMKLGAFHVKSWDILPKDARRLLAS